MGEGAEQWETRCCPRKARRPARYAWRACKQAGRRAGMSALQGFRWWAISIAPCAAAPDANRTLNHSNHSCWSGRNAAAALTDDDGSQNCAAAHNNADDGASAEPIAAAGSAGGCVRLSKRVNDDFTAGPVVQDRCAGAWHCRQQGKQGRQEEHRQAAAGTMKGG